VANVDKIDTLQNALATFHVPELPDWVTRIPAVGAPIKSAWDQFVGAGASELVARAAPYLGDVTKWTVSRLGGFGFAIVQFLLTVAVAAGLWANGETVANGVRLLARRIGGSGESRRCSSRGRPSGAWRWASWSRLSSRPPSRERLADRGDPVRSGAHRSGVLPLHRAAGAVSRSHPAIGWLYWSGHTGWGTFLLVWSLPIGVMDNLLRPILIKRGADLPLVLVFAGVIGGLVTLGLIGIFVGPVMLAVVYALAKAWVLQPEAQGG